MSEEQKPQETKTDMIAAAKGLPPTEIFSLKPRTFEEAFRFANLIAESTLIPKEFQKNPANVLIAVQLGMELGVSPMQALQNIAVVNGRPTIWGDLLPAIVYASGLMEQFDEQGDDKQASCTVKRRGFAPITRTFTMEEAKKAIAYEWEGGQRRTISLADKQTYKSYPKRMLAMRARAFAMRDAFADVLKGVAVHEDIDDIPGEARDVTPAPLRQPQALAAAPKGDSKVEDPRQPSASTTEKKEDGQKSNRMAEPTTADSKPAQKTRTRREPIEENKAAPESAEKQIEKTQEEWIAECELWIENATAEELLSDNNWLFTVGIKQLHGMKNQMEALKPFNARRHALAKAQ